MEGAQDANSKPLVYDILPRTATETFTQFLSSEHVLFKFTVALRTQRRCGLLGTVGVGGGGGRTVATSTFTQLVSSETQD